MDASELSRTEQRIVIKALRFARKEMLKTADLFARNPTKTWGDVCVLHVQRHLFVCDALDTYLQKVGRCDLLDAAKMEVFQFAASATPPAFNWFGSDGLVSMMKRVTALYHAERAVRRLLELG